MYEFITEFIGELPTEFKFIYAILTLVFGLLVISFFFSVFYIPINYLRK